MTYKLDRDRAKIQLKEAIRELMIEGELEDREFLVGEETINYMAEAALNVLLAIEDVNTTLKDEELLKWKNWKP